MLTRRLDGREAIRISFPGLVLVSFQQCVTRCELSSNQAHSTTPLFRPPTKPERVSPNSRLRAFSSVMQHRKDGSVHHLVLPSSLALAHLSGPRVSGTAA